MEYSGAWEKLIHEKNWSRKPRGTVPLTSFLGGTQPSEILTNHVWILRCNHMKDKRTKNSCVWRQNLKNAKSTCTSQLFFQDQKWTIQNFPFIYLETVSSILQRDLREKNLPTPPWRLEGYFLENVQDVLPNNNPISSFSVPGRRLIGNFWIRTAQYNVHMKCTRTLILTYWKIYRFTRIRIQVRMSNLVQNAQDFTGNDESGSGKIRNFFPGLFRSRYR